MKLRKLLSLQTFLILFSLSSFAQEGAQPAQTTSAPAVVPSAAAVANAGMSPMTAQDIMNQKNADGTVRAKQVRKIKQDIAEAVTHLNDGGAPEAANKLKGEIDKLIDYDKHLAACAEREKTAEKICREKTNPAIAQAIPIVQAIVTAVAGAKDACSKFAKASDVLNKALLVYQATCASTKALCQSSCSKAEAILKKSQENVPKIMNAGAEQIVNKNQPLPSDVAPIPAIKAKNIAHATAVQNLANPTAEKIKVELGEAADTISSNLETCSGFNTQLQSAAVGMVGLIQSMGQSNKCDKQMTANQTPPATEVNCSLPANQNLTKCICEANPRTVGCATGLNNAANAKSSEGFASTDLGGTGINSGKDPAFVASGGGDAMAPPESAGTGPGGGAAPSGGGPGMDGGSGGGGGPDNANQKSASRLNANVLGAEGGGGGGGWGGSGEEDSDEGLRDYLPGGEKDPTGLAGQVATKEVTSEGGKSNWEKVRERYRDNKPTLLGY